MNKFLFFTVLIFLFGCDDGDLQIENLDFDSASIQHCDPVEVDLANVLFKLNSTEALILELPSGSIKNEVTDGSLIYLVSASGPSKITYRTFSDKVATNYFCTDIPLSTPTVLDEIIAEGGEVIITTALNADEVTYTHTIELSGISLVTSTNTRITNLTIDNFGTVTTTLSE